MTDTRPFAGIEFPDEECEEIRYYRADGVCLLAIPQDSFSDPVGYIRSAGEEPAFKVVWRINSRALRREPI